MPYLSMLMDLISFLVFIISSMLLIFHDAQVQDALVPSLMNSSAVLRNMPAVGDSPTFVTTAGVLLLGHQDSDTFARW